MIIWIQFNCLYHRININYTITSDYLGISCDSFIIFTILQMGISLIFKLSKRVSQISKVDLLHLPPFLSPSSPDSYLNSAHSSSSQQLCNKPFALLPEPSRTEHTTLFPCTSDFFFCLVLPSSPQILEKPFHRYLDQILTILNPLFSSRR